MMLNVAGYCIGNGILTVENLAQAEERADPQRQNKGGGGGGGGAAPRRAAPAIRFQEQKHRVFGGQFRSRPGRKALRDREGPKVRARREAGAAKFASSQDFTRCRHCRKWRRPAKGLESVKEEFEEHRFGAVIDGAQLAAADKEFFKLLVTAAVEKQRQIDPACRKRARGQVADRQNRPHSSRLVPRRRRRIGGSEDTAQSRNQRISGSREGILSGRQGTSVRKRRSRSYGPRSASDVFFERSSSLKFKRPIRKPTYAGRSSSNPIAQAVRTVGKIIFENS